MKVKCNKIMADTALKMEQIHAETQRISAEITSRCNAEIELLSAQTQACKMELEAETQQIQMVGEAKAMEIVARAEGAAAKKVDKLRSHLVEMQKLDLLHSLAKNPKTIVTGNASNSLLAEMLVANKQGNVLLNVGENGLKGLIKTA